MSIPPTAHPFIAGPTPDLCYHRYHEESPYCCHRPREEHPVTLPVGPPVRTDYERALERIQELEAENLRLTEDAQRHETAIQGITGMAREILARIESLVSR